MQHIERRAALSAFLWTVTVMALAGGALFYKADIIPQVPTNANAAAASDATVAEYATALDTANSRLTEAGNRITDLQNQLAQRTSAAAPAVDGPQQPAGTQTAVSAEQAIEYAKQIAGSLQPISAPELVDLEGQTVWSIAYTPGTVYVSAQDGSIALVERNQQQHRRPGHDDEQHESGPSGDGD